MSYNVSLRPINNKDLAFLEQLYASTRQDEVALTGWGEQQQADFLKFQFEAQHKHYMREYKGSQFDIMMLNKRPIGRLYLQRRKDEFRIIDIALLPKYRSQGIGSKFMNNILAEARTVGLPVRIHVEQYNPARRFYHRLGFKEIGENGVYYLMEWSPDKN